MVIYLLYNFDISSLEWHSNKVTKHVQTGKGSIFWGALMCSVIEIATCSLDTDILCGNSGLMWC